MGKLENLQNRDWLAERLRAEIVGPDPAGEPCALDVDGKEKIFTWEQLRAPKKQLNGEEIIWQDPPSKRYGAGILYPQMVTETAELNEPNQSIETTELPEATDKELSLLKKLEAQVERNQLKSLKADDTEELDVNLANSFKPSAIGLSFMVDLSKEKEGLSLDLVSVSKINRLEKKEIAPAYYVKREITIGGKEGEVGAQLSKRSIWIRSPLTTADGGFISLTFTNSELLDPAPYISKKIEVPGKHLEAVLIKRKLQQSDPNTRLITISLVNRSISEKSVDEVALFQAGIRVRCSSGAEAILSYPDLSMASGDGLLPSSDELVNKLLYRQYKTFAIGHGCAADWDGVSPDAVSEAWSDVMPSYEIPTISPDLYLKTESGPVLFRSSMRKLGGLDPADDGFKEIDQLISLYQQWIEGLKKGLVNQDQNIGSDLYPTANYLLERCEQCLSRIKRGVDLLNGVDEKSKKARQAFVLANKAMLISQLRSDSGVREPIAGGKSWIPEMKPLDLVTPNEKRGFWRPFQIAFLLLSLEGIVNPDSQDRDIVDLIWFPTGGGKTEAYLGLTAFTIFYNHLAGNKAGGVDVLMRYTLRLLTAQQFQRASLLFCAMEYMRRQDVAMLGQKPYSIGLWVGGDTAPNKRVDALSKLKALQADSSKENPFILLKCPWCSAKFGPELGKERSPIYGYKKARLTSTSPETVVYRCSDPKCDFSSKPAQSNSDLPIVVIDEDIFDNPPNLLIGTVDKFATLAWKPEIRSIFGIDVEGNQVGMPPSLIIQDELHLISGPLGSMVGLYETLIEKLCVDDRTYVKPKIVASTATISRANEQVKNLYARENVSLFPPSGLDVGDSFFSREARDEFDQLIPGRRYLGVMAPGHGSLQTTEARVFATLLQFSGAMDKDNLEKDPWWTLLCYFNSIRELGSAATLFVSDARDYLRVLIDRHGIPYKNIRKLFNVTELTSRIRGDQVPQELEKLSKSLSGDPANSNDDIVDACLASNIIEVGVDIPRLSLMAIVGQPKTTSQYIQVSSRVGRDNDKPGLVCILYGQSKPRDRSHFERFRSYHQALYAQVEPTSVTPFSAPAVDRALHGIIVAAVRQLGRIDQEGIHPSPFPLEDGSKLKDLIESMIEDRVVGVAPEERDNVLEKMRQRLKEWRIWDPAEYGGFGLPPQNAPLMHPAGSVELPEWTNRSWSTLSSLRNVDASCEGVITGFFNEVDSHE
jgi:hypothetical protein